MMRWVGWSRKFCDYTTMKYFMVRSLYLVNFLHVYSLSSSSSSETSSSEVSVFFFGLGALPAALAAFFSFFSFFAFLAASSNSFPPFSNHRRYSTSYFFFSSACFFSYFFFVDSSILFHASPQCFEISATPAPGSAFFAASLPSSFIHRKYADIGLLG